MLVWDARKVEANVSSFVLLLISYEEVYNGATRACYPRRRCVCQTHELVSPHACPKCVKAKKLNSVLIQRYESNLACCLIIPTV